MSVHLKAGGCGSLLHGLLKQIVVSKVEMFVSAKDFHMQLTNTLNLLQQPLPFQRTHPC